MYSMKHFFSHILRLSSYLLLSVVVCSCSENLFADLQTAEKEEGREFTVDFSIDFSSPVATSSTTRSFGEQLEEPDKASIILLSFDENHFLNNVFVANYKSTEQEGGTQHNYYTVTLKESEEPHFLHVLVNYNTLDINEIPYGTESDIFNSQLMTVGQDTAVYWQRVSLPQIDEATVTEKLSHLKLIRNFSKITLTLNSVDIARNAVGTLVNAQWGLAYVPSRGSVAPYLKDQEFANYLRENEDGTTDIADYETLTKDGYVGHVPRRVGDDTFYLITSDFENNIQWKSVNEPLYTFENEGSSNSSLFERTLIFLKGKFRDTDGNVDSSDSYYRLSLVDPTNNYEILNILRNIEYNIRVTSISSTGYVSAEVAAERPANNNLSGSTVTNSYPTVVMDDSSLRVEYVKKYILSPGEFSLSYRYIPDVNNLDDNGNYVTNNDMVLIKTLTGGALGTSIVNDYSKVTDEEVGQVLSEFKFTDTNKDNMRLVYFKPNPDNIHVGGLVETAHIRVSAADKPSLYRDIEFILRERYKMENMNIVRDDSYIGYDMDGTQTYGTDSCYTLVVDIPTGMPEELFPLDFTLESQPSVIYPNVRRSVMEVSGSHASIFDQTVKNTFHYHRAVAKNTYNTLRSSHGYGGFTESNNRKQITFFFRLNDPLLTSDAMKTDASGNSYVIIRMGVYCDTFSSSPEEDRTASIPHILEAYYKFTKTNGYYVAEPIKDTSTINTDSEGYFYLEE